MDQGLPIAFENNAATWQNMPGMAAFYTGRQNQIAQDNIAALQKAFEAEQAYKAQTRPVELQNLIKSGALTEAQARHADALSRLTGLSSDKAKAVMPGEIASTNAKNQTEVVNANQQQHAIQTTRYAAWLEAGGNKMPKFMQAQKFMETFGVDPKYGDEVLQNIPKLVQMIPQEARKLYELSPTGQQASQKEAGDDRRTGMTTQAMRDVANINAKSRENIQAAKSADTAQSTLQAVTSGKLGYEKAATIFTTLASIEADPKVKAVYEEMASKFEQANLAQKAAGITGKVDPGALGLPTQQPNRVLGGNGGLAPGTQLYFDAQGNLVQGKQ